MGKAARQRVLNDNQAKAVLKTYRISPQKLNLIAQQIRGMHVQDAVDQLTFSRKAAAKDVRKLLQSAIANAENNHDLDIDALYVTEATVGKSLTMKRWRARARGRGVRITKPFSNITIVVSENQERLEAE